MEKMRMESIDMTAQNIDKIAELFPNCITEMLDEEKSTPDKKVYKKAINFEILKQMLSKDVLEGDEAYEFTWVGKKASIVEANKPIRKTLRPCPEESVNWDTTENLYIEGDNLEVLKLLQESYLGKVKMIYIDPPYNTGNDFIYNDDFKMTGEEYAEESGENDGLGNRMYKNTDSNGRFHSDWCSMMYSRLMLARNLLTTDGCIFISIDENEVNALKSICDEVFGSSNFIADLIWSAGRKNDSKHISVSHEYILCYFRDAQYIKEHQIIWREEKQGLTDIYSKYDSLRKQYGKDNERIEVELKFWFNGLPNGHPAKDHMHYSKVDDNGIFFADNISWPGGGGPKYDILHPVTKKAVKIPSRGWLTNENTMKQWIAEGRVSFGKDEIAVPTLKSYLKDREMTVPYSVFYKDGRASSKRLASLMGDKVFENPKDEEIIQRLIEFCGTEDDDIVMDFFSGSATTAHAVFLSNIRQSKKRKFILVQIPEPINSKNAKTSAAKKVAENAIILLNSINANYNICEIGKERIRRAGKKILEENKDKEGIDNLDIGFRVLKVDDSNMTDVYYTPAEYSQDLLSMLESNVKEDRTDLDLLFGCLLEWGLPLSLPYHSEKVDGCTVHDYNDGDLIACFDENIPESVMKEIAKKQPLRAVFRDSSFADSPSKLYGKGYSADNLKLMRRFYLIYSKDQIGETVFPQFENYPKASNGRKFYLSWSHYLKLMRIENVEERHFYEIESVKNDWSLSELKRQFNTSLYERIALSTDKDKVYQLAMNGQAKQSAKDLVKDPYILEFLGLPEVAEYSENKLETEIINHLQQFLLELGTGFAFMGRQVRFTFEEEHFMVDLVFYNRLLRCFVLFDLKIGELKHQDIGQMQMYVNYYDRKVKMEGENSTIGIILCKDKNKAVVEMTLPEGNSQIFASKYETVLPQKEDLRKLLEAHRGKTKEDLG